MIQSGKAENLPYSLSRWTDLSGSPSKWAWFRERLAEGWMLGFDPRTALPSKWSLRPEDTLGLIFWTREAKALVRSADLLQAYPLVIHYTLTGWHEVEKGSPSIDTALGTMRDTVAAFGADNVVWRFSPVPVVDDAVERFERIAKGVEGMGIKDVFVSFLQENSTKNEARPSRFRRELLRQMAARTSLTVQVCFEDDTKVEDSAKGLRRGVCESGQRFSTSMGIDWPKTEGCGCALAIDPFTINESCAFGCQYCYAADAKKRSTTKNYHLPVIQ